MQTDTAPDTSSEHGAIEAVIEGYLDAGREGRSELARPVFERAATMRGYLHGALLDGTAQDYFAYVDEHGPARELVVRSRSIEIAGTAAVARLEIENWHGIRYTDFLSLLRFDGRWMIAAKVFFAHAHATAPAPSTAGSEA